MKVEKELAGIVRDIEDAGGSVTRRRNGHLRWTLPNGALVFTSFSPSDRHALHRIRRDLRHNGWTDAA